jgi:hypothetical protein
MKLLSVVDGKVILILLTQSTAFILNHHIVLNTDREAESLGNMPSRRPRKEGNPWIFKI